MTRALVFVESNSTGTGRLMVKAAAELGFRPIVLASDAARYAFIEQDGIAVHTVDTQSEAEVREACRVIQARDGVAGVTSSSEYFVGLAAAIAEQLGLPAPPAAAIRACADKSTQRRRLDLERVEVPRWCHASTVAEALAAADQLGWPVVLKPVSGSGSIGVKLCRTAGEVASHAAALVERKVNERGIEIPRGLLIEAFVDGPEYSVEAFSSRIIGITAKRLGSLPHFLEIGHDFPAELGARAREELEATTLAALRALGLEVGPAHVELRVGPNGPAIIEVNPRLAGGFIPDLVRLATGVDLLEANVRFASGSPMSLDASWDRHASIRFLLPAEDGVLAEVRGLDRAASIRHVVEAVGYRAAGAPVSRRGDFRDRIGHVIACGARREEVLRDLEAAHGCVSVLVTPQASSESAQVPIAAARMDG